MAEYDSFIYLPELPEGMEIPESVGVYNRQIYSDRSDITAAVVRMKCGLFEMIYSYHSRIQIAEKKVKEYTKSNSDPDVKFISIPVNLKPRNKTYFSGNNFGNAQDIAVFDTSEWTMEMWALLRYNYRGQEMATHFAGGVHEYEDKKVWRGRKSLELPVCKTCGLLREELYLV